MGRTIGYDSIEDVLLNIEDPNTWGTISNVPWVSSPKINWWTSVYNIPEWEWGQWIAGWSTDISWSSTTAALSWTSWNLYLPDWTSYPISSWRIAVSTNTYLYLDQTDWTIKSTTSALSAVWENKIMVCVAFPNTWKRVSFQAFGCADQSSLITWANIATRTIVASNIASWEITANEIASNTITANEIKSWAVTASKIDVSQLSAISANLWTITAWSITGTTITAGDTSWTAIVLNPNNNRIQIYYNGNIVWYIYWTYVSWAGSAVSINGNYVAIPWTAFMSGKLRIPVWTDLYE